MTVTKNIIMGRPVRVNDDVAWLSIINILIEMWIFDIARKATGNIAVSIPTAIGSLTIVYHS